MSKEQAPLWKRAMNHAIGNDSPELPLTNRILKRIPGGDFAQQQLDRIEQRLMVELKHRLDRLEGQDSRLAVMAFSVETKPPTADQQQRAAGELMRKLLEASGEQTRAQAQSAYYAVVVGGLLPDEARILSALSDGSGYPLLHVHSASKIGLGAAVPVLENISSVGKDAGVLWQDMTRGYVRRLIAAGLAETGPEDPAQMTKYEILEADELVRNTLEKIRKGGQRAQIKRRTLSISELGSSLWEACRISED